MLNMEFVSKSCLPSPKMRKTNSLFILNAKIIQETYSVPLVFNHKTFISGVFTDLHNLVTEN